MFLASLFLLLIVLLNKVYLLRIQLNIVYLFSIYFAEKEKELAVEAYNSLRSRNEFLKLQVRPTSYYRQLAFP